jgi:hypothetical protein
MRMIMGRSCSSLDYANLWRNKLVREAIMILRKILQQASLIAYIKKGKYYEKCCREAKLDPFEVKSFEWFLEALRDGLLTGQRVPAGSLFSWTTAVSSLFFEHCNQKIKLIQQGTIKKMLKKWQLVDPQKQAAALTKTQITTYVKEAPTNEKSLLCKAILVVGVMGLLRKVCFFENVRFSLC